MKRLLKNSSLIAFGLITGLTLSSFASNESIMAVRDNITSIFVKGEQINAKPDDAPINYQGKLYVPLRTISEKMGLVVDYNKSSKSVYITEKPLTKEEKLAQHAEIYNEAMADFQKAQAKNVEDARKEDIKKESSVDYKDLPISFRKDKFFMKLTLTVKSNSDNNSEFYFDVKNDGDSGIVIDPFSAKFDYSDAHAERQLDTSDVNIGLFDKKVLSSIDAGFDDKLYLTLKEIPKDIKQGTLSFNIYPVGEDSNITKVIMPIKLD
ncbi:MAG: stalk domain-containing protein [Peptoanaerobacter stomatis]|uniref:stalk domain-containing protein n=1 Tax=Peptoanaerobacter stomatis TaxID=796937 RepID=UPI003FA17931